MDGVHGKGAAFRLLRCARNNTFLMVHEIEIRREVALNVKIRR